MRLHHLQRRDKSLGKWKVPGDERRDVIACSGVRTADPSSCRPRLWDGGSMRGNGLLRCINAAWLERWKLFCLEKPLPHRSPPLVITNTFRARRKRSNRREVRWLLVINSLTDIGCVYHPECRWRRAKIPTSWGSVAVMLIGQMMEPKDRALQAGLRSLRRDFFFFLFSCLWGSSARVWIKHDAPPHASSNVDTCFPRRLTGAGIKLLLFIYF